MSINSALLAGVSGLVANSSALAAISDNIANVNTIAYKRNEVSFANVVTSQAVAGRYSAGGVQGINKQYVSQQGLVQASGSSTDLAISGDGFFVVSSKGAGLTAADPRSFTRAGSFTVDADGFLVNKSNFYLQGWPVQANGAFDVNPSDLSKMGAINVKNLGAAVSATTAIKVSANLDKSQVLAAAAGSLGPPAVAPTYVAASNTSMADYANGVATGTKPDFTIEMNVTDSTGGSRKVAMAFLKSSAAPNEWNAEIYAIPASDVQVGTNEPGQISKGLVHFNPDGSINLATTTLFGAAGSPATISLAASTATGTAAAPAWGTALGVSGQSLALDLAKITQYAATSTVNSISSDGAGVGNIVAINVDEAGVVSAIYDNSQIRKVAKVGVATFPNADGLQAISGNAYRTSLKAGQMVVKEAGEGGAGHISPSSLEASTVDLSAEFTGLIQTQKAYSASSKIITTADQMLEELINIKR
ncbi:flagellar hook protein FlgE [Phenylobacterium sp.]|uniref:flagellar hook protein FlgE n=1 Tax=Phenylobacterium sp. TaxID=1871053 RepID=UPI00260013CA|nr:flagellar hook protein FlgE [Phenylobacterium sp.]